MNYLDTAVNQNTLVDLLSYRANHQGDHIAYTFLLDGESRTDSLNYRELHRKAMAIAGQLQSVCQPGDRALLLHPPSLDYIAAFFGCLYAGVVAVPAYPPRPKRPMVRLQTIIQNSQAKVALTTNAIISSLEKRLDQAPQLKTLGWLATDNLNLDYAQNWQAPDLSRDSLAFLQYTSGSTAAPKGVMVSHGNLIHNLDAIMAGFGNNSQSKGVIWLPPYHDMGLIGGVLQPLYGNASVTLMSPLMFLQNPLRWLQAIARTKSNVSGGPNFAYDLCLRKINPEQLVDLDLSCWEVAFNGAEPINPQTLEQFAHKFAPCGFRYEAFYPCYGLAEATLIVCGGKKASPPVTKTVQAQALEQNQVISAMPGQLGSRTLVGCGHSLPDQRVVIVNPQSLAQCQEGEIGEIWVWGASVAQGYWHQPEATQATFEAHLADTSEEPFLRTGDLGFMDNGELFVTGRIKDMIIINGRNHYPQDIEWTVEQSHSAIRPSCTAAFSVSVEGKEELVIVTEVERRYLKYLQQENHSNNNRQPEDLDSNSLIESIQRAVSQHHELPVYAVVLLKPGTIPKTSSGKIQRHRCRAKFLNGDLNVIHNTF